ncbi:MAG: acyl-CoA dehydrogenase, partial [Flavobacteriaceae bacterium]|nr:acyl-CoA dehydrogenase [Flavobacteriaceae bacterium]
SLLGIPSFETPDYTVLFAEEKEMIAKLKKAFLMVAGKAVQIYGMELEKQQQLILAAAEILMEIYMAESTILKTEKLVNITSEGENKARIAMAKLNLFNAVELSSKKGKEAIASFAEGDEQRVMLMGLKRFTKYTNLPNVIALRNVIADDVIAANKYCF